MPSPMSQFTHEGTSALVPEYQALMTRIRRAEKFTTPISESDRILYRQFKFGNYSSTSIPTTSTSTSTSTNTNSTVSKPRKSSHTLSTKAVPPIPSKTQTPATKAKSTLTLFGKQPSSVVSTNAFTKALLASTNYQTPSKKTIKSAASDPLMGVSDQDRLTRLKRAYKFGLQTPEVKALEGWYLGKHGQIFDPSKL